MATRKTESQKTIEKLQAENEGLRRRNAFADWLGHLPSKRKTQYALALSLLVLVVVLFFTYQVMMATKPIPMSPERYELLLSEVDKRTWKVAKASTEALFRHIRGTPSGYAYTRREGDCILLHLRGEMETVHHFSYSEGKVIGFLSSSPVLLQYSESALKSGRALTLEIEEDKIVFYEEK